MKSNEVKAECSGSRVIIRGDWDELTGVGDGCGIVDPLLLPSGDKVRHPQQRPAVITLWQVGDEGPGGKSG